MGVVVGGVKGMKESTVVGRMITNNITLVIRRRAVRNMVLMEVLMGVLMGDG